MKLIIRASILSLAAAGIFAGFAANHSAQTVTVSHLAMSAAMPSPTCEPGTPCTMHGR